MEWVNHCYSLDDSLGLHGKKKKEKKRKRKEKGAISPSVRKVVAKEEEGQILFRGRCPRNRTAALEPPELRHAPATKVKNFNEIKNILFGGGGVIVNFRRVQASGRGVANHCQINQTPVALASPFFRLNCPPFQSPSTQPVFPPIIFLFCVC